MQLSKKLSLFFLGLTLFVSGYAQNEPIDSAHIKKLRIDPGMAIGVPASEVYAKVEYIPLETTDKSLFGTVNQLQIVDGKFIFHDMDTWSVFIFDDNGKFINKITAKNVAVNAGIPAGTSQSLVLRAFDIVKEGNKAYIEIKAGKFLLKYDLTGKLIEKSLSEITPKTYLLANGTKVVPFYTEDKKTYYDFALFRQDKPERYFPFSLSKFEEDDFYTQGSRFFPAADYSSIIFIDYYSYDVLSVSANGVSLKYRFILPQQLAMPHDFVPNPKYRAKKWDYIRQNKQMIYGIHNVVEMGQYLYFTLDQYSQQIADKKTIAYHLPTGKMLSLQHIIPDSSTYFLPTNDAAYGSNFMTKGFLQYDDKSFYTVISSLSMFRFNAENTADKSLYPAHLKKYFSGTSKDNAVIVKLTPKP